MSNELRNRILKASTSEYKGTLEESEIFNNQDVIPTPIPALNIAYSGRLDGGVPTGITVWAGPSKHFKTMFCLISAAAYMKKYPDATLIFYDNEFGSPKEYFESVGIDPSRVVHIPFLTMEDLRTDITNVLKSIKRGDKAIIIVDSYGNSASAKEVKDAEDGSEKADMTRAKTGKSLFRIITPHAKLKDIPVLVVAHTYDTMEMYSKKVVSGGTGIYYSAANIYIIGRQQEKDGADLAGYNFVINVEKSRYTKEKSKIPITVLREGGIQKWSGMLELAVAGGYIHRPNNRTYLVTDPETGEVLDETRYTRAQIVANGEVFRRLFSETTFPEYIKRTFMVATGPLVREDDIVDEFDEFDEDFIEEEVDDN